MGERPKIKLKYSGFEKIIELVAMVTIIISVWILIKYYKKLPSIIPTHFNGVGKPNGYGGKGSLFISPIVAIIIYFSLTILSKFPHIFNYPLEITNENAEFQYRNARTMINLIKVQIVICFTYIEWISVKVALGKTSGIVPWFIIIFLIVLFGTLILDIKKMLKH